MKSNRSIKTTGLRHGIAFLSALLLTSGGLSAGVIKITTSPSFDSNNNVFIRPNQSVTFSASASNTKDTIKSWAWTFTTGSPATADVQNPTGPIAFSSSAGYGQANDCYVGVSTTGTNGETCTASDKTPLAHVYVNVLQGNLQNVTSEPSDFPSNIKITFGWGQQTNAGILCYGFATQATISPGQVPNSVTWGWERWVSESVSTKATADSSWSAPTTTIALHQDSTNSKSTVLTSLNHLYLADDPGYAVPLGSNYENQTTESFTVYLFAQAQGDSKQNTLSSISFNVNSIYDRNASGYQTGVSIGF